MLARPGRRTGHRPGLASRRLRRDPPRPTAPDADPRGDGHGNEGPGSAFALRVRPGEEAGLFDEGIVHHAPADARQLLVADESGAPAALAILETAPADLVATAFLEVPGGGDIRTVAAPPGVEVHWLPRNGDDRLPGRLALETLAASALPAAPYYAWIAGESGLATGARRFLTRERNVPESDIAFLGHWEAGRSAPG